MDEAKNNLIVKIEWIFLETLLGCKTYLMSLKEDFEHFSILMDRAIKDLK
jgi:hypothetical protein